MKFEVGDRVEAIRDSWRVREGDTGTVVAVHRVDVSVEWDRYMNGHDCDGRCKMGYGSYIDVCDLIDISDHVELSDDDLALLLE